MVFLLFLFYFILLTVWMVAHGVWVLPGGLSLLVTPHDLHMDLEFEDIVLTASALSPMFHLPILVMYSIAS